MLFDLAFQMKRKYNTFLLHVATKLRNDSLGRMTRTYKCEANDATVV